MSSDSIEVLTELTLQNIHMAEASMLNPSDLTAEHTLTLQNNTPLLLCLYIFGINIFSFIYLYSRTSMARTPLDFWNHENMFETKVVRAKEF